MSNQPYEVVKVIDVQSNKSVPASVKEAVENFWPCLEFGSGDYCYWSTSIKGLAEIVAEKGGYYPVKDAEVMMNFLMNLTSDTEEEFLIRYWW